MRPVDLVGDRVHEGGVAFELGEAERGPERPHQSIHDVGDDVLSVIELDAGHEARITGNVGDRETGRFRLSKHRGALPFHQPSEATGLLGNSATLTCDMPRGELAVSFQEVIHSVWPAVDVDVAKRRWFAASRTALSSSALRLDRAPGTAEEIAAAAIWLISDVIRRKLG